MTGTEFGCGVGQWGGSPSCRNGARSWAVADATNLPRLLELIPAPAGRQADGWVPIWFQNVAQLPNMSAARKSLRSEAGRNNCFRSETVIL
jgi:hypothetical protein